MSTGIPPPSANILCGLEHSRCGDGRAAVWQNCQTHARRAIVGKLPEDDHEYELHYRLVAVDPLAQQTTGEMRMLLFKDRQLVADDIYTLTSNYYFRNEMQLLLEKAGFTIEAEKGDWTDADVTADHDVIVYIARK